MIKPEDDYFHPRSDSPYWNESSWIQFMVPERQIDGWAYFYHRPNMNLSAGGVALWDPSGEQSYDCLFYEWDEHQALPDGADMYDFSLRNGLTVECVEPLKSFRVSFKNADCQLELTWDAIMDPYEAPAPKSEVVNPGLVDWGTGHYDQFGRARGQVHIEGESLDIDCFSVRDHSWGPRQDGTATFLRGSWPWAVASETSAFSCWAMSRLPLDEDPIAGTTEPVAAGWYTRDGIIGQLVSGERRVVERGSDGRPMHEIVDAKDHLGREFHAEGRPANLLKWHAYTTFFNHWSLARWEFDGQEAWGEMNDYFTVRQMRRFQQSLRRRRLST